MHENCKHKKKHNNATKILKYTACNNLGIRNIKYNIFQMIIRKFTVAIILLNLNKYFSKNHGYGYRSLAPQDGSKSMESQSIFVIIYLHLSGSFNYYLPVSRSRQLSNSESEGRNFFLEKLCELGLGEVSQLHDI